MSNASDVELLAACHSDPDAFAVFYRRYERLVAGWLVRQCRRPDLAAELTAEVFARAGPRPPRVAAPPAARSTPARTSSSARTAHARPGLVHL
jgi:DNA-directed RNA polymerase specialized sigma24 family protein